MDKEFNLGGNMKDFGREVLKEVIRTDYGPKCSFNGIAGHESQVHHGGQHDQVVLYKEGVKASEFTFRFFDSK